MERLVVPNRLGVYVVDDAVDAGRDKRGTKRGRGPANCGGGRGTSVSDVALRRFKHL